MKVGQPGCEWQDSRWVWLSEVRHHQNQLSLRHPKPHHSRWWCNWGLTLRKPRKSRCTRKWILQDSCTQGYALHHGLQPQGHGKRKQAHRLNTEIVFLPQNSSKRVRRLAEKEIGMRGTQSDLELHSTWPCVYDPGKTNPAQKQRKMGPRRNHSQGR